MVGSYGVFNISILTFQHINDHIFQTSFFKFYKEEGGTTTSSIFKAMHLFLALINLKTVQSLLKEKLFRPDHYFFTMGDLNMGAAAKLL